MTTKAMLLLLLCISSTMVCAEDEALDAFSVGSLGAGGSDPRVQPLVATDDYFILYIGGQILHVERKTGVSKVLLGSGQYYDRSRVHSLHTIQLMDVKADKERIYAIEHASERGRATLKLKTFLQKDGSALRSFELIVRGAGMKEFPEGTILIGSRQGEIPKTGIIAVGENCIEFWGAKVFYDAGNIVKIEHAPEKTEEK